MNKILLNISYPSDLWTPERDNEIHLAAGYGTNDSCDLEGTGMGFGYRDLEYCFDNLIMAKAAKKRIEELDINIECKLNTDVFS